MARVVIVGTEAESKCELQRQRPWRGERASSPGAPGRADPTSPRPSGKPLTKGLFPPSTTEAPVLAGSRPGEICRAHDDGGASARLGRKRLNFYAGQSCPLGPGRRHGPLSSADRAVAGADRRREIIYFSSCETSMSNEWDVPPHVRARSGVGIPSSRETGRRQKRGGPLAHHTKHVCGEPGVNRSGTPLLRQGFLRALHPFPAVRRESALGTNHRAPPGFLKSPDRCHILRHRCFLPSRLLGDLTSSAPGP